MKKERLGIFGGTFNPPHIGHIKSAAAFINQMSLDRLIIMPSFIPPHKEYNSIVSSYERLEMSKIAFEDLPKTVVSDLEIQRGGKSYTYLTLEEMAQDGTELYFLCGTDMLLTMGEWKNPEIIFKLAHICCARREDKADITSELNSKILEYESKFKADVHMIDVDPIDISSTELRNNPEAHREYISDKVYKYIIERGLYK